jgi:hypothetical protein
MPISCVSTLTKYVRGYRVPQRSSSRTAVMMRTQCPQGSGRSPLLSPYPPSTAIFGPRNPLLIENSFLYDKATRQVLAEVYNWFTAGCDTADLQEAKALLADLA